MRGTGRELPALGLTAPSPQPPPGAAPCPRAPRSPPAASYRAATEADRRTGGRTDGQGPNSRRAAPPPPAFSHHSDRQRGRGPAPRPPPAPLGRSDRGSLAPNPKARCLKPSPGPSPALPAAAARAWAATMSRSSAAETRTRSRPSAIFPRARPAAETGRGGGEGRRPGGDKKSNRERGTEPRGCYYGVWWPHWRSQWPYWRSQWPCLGSW